MILKRVLLAVLLDRGLYNMLYTPSHSRQTPQMMVSVWPFPRGSNGDYGCVFKIVFVCGGSVCTGYLKFLLVLKRINAGGKRWGLLHICSRFAFYSTFYLVCPRMLMRPAAARSGVSSRGLYTRMRAAIILMLWA